MKNTHEKELKSSSPTSPGLDWDPIGIVVCIIEYWEFVYRLINGLIKSYLHLILVNGQFLYTNVM